MALPMPLAAMTNEAGQAVRNIGKNAAMYCVLALVGLTGVGFLLAACYIALAAATSALLAAIIIGGTLLAIAAVMAGIMMQRAKRRKQLARKRTANTALMASSVSLAATGLKIASRVKNPLFWPAAATLVVGWYLTQHRSKD